MRLAICLLLAACSGSSSPKTSPDLAQPACTSVARTCDQVMATFSTGSSDVTASCDAAAGTFTIRSTGMPNYTSNQTTPNPIKDQMWVVVLPLAPACAATPTPTIESRGPIGFMVNGVPFYGPEDANGNDAVVNEGPSFDDCEGHADMTCAYHYHEEPTCVFGKATSIASQAGSDGHPAVIGYALDGFALHGSDPTATLDTCNGHVDATRGYHYHASAASPYLIGCLEGKATGTMSRTKPTCP